MDIRRMLVSTHMLESSEVDEGFEVRIRGSPKLVEEVLPMEDDPNDENILSRLLELEKAYFCARCLNAFTTRKSLKVHHSTVHLKQKPHKCRICHRYFGTRSSMTRHMKTKHSQSGTGDMPVGESSASFILVRFFLP